MEKAYRAWGSELTNEVTLVEAGMERFIGNLRARDSNRRSNLVYLEVDAVDADCLGDEPVYVDDQVVGVTTGGAYGFAVQKSLAFAYVAMPPEGSQSHYQILVRGRLLNARRIAECAWDPRNERLRA
jgi:dimethylglycine dehydrogenase